MIFKKAIPRRTVLRGLGATLALPLLDSMVPAFAAPAEAASKSAGSHGIRIYSPGRHPRKVDAGYRRRRLPDDSDPGAAGAAAG